MPTAEAMLARKYSAAAASWATMASVCSLPCLAMRQRFVHAGDDLHVQHRVQPLGVEILLGRRRQGGADCLRGLIGLEGAALGREVSHQQRQQGRGHGGVDQQGLGRAANACATHFGVGQHGARHGEIGRTVDIGVVQPLGMRQHGHARLFLYQLHQRLAAAGDDEVQQPRGLQHGGDEAAVRAGRHLHGVLGQPGGA